MEQEAKSAPNGGTQTTQVPALQNRKTVAFEKRGEDGKMYSGDFTFKRLTIAEVAKVGAETARLNGSMAVDPTTDFINTMLAHFAVAIVDAPKWWDPYNIYDLDLMKGVFDLLLDFERSFRASESRQGSTPS